MRKELLEAKTLSKRFSGEKIRFEEEYQSLRKRLDLFMSKGHKNIISEDAKFLEELKYYQVWIFEREHCIFRIS